MYCESYDANNNWKVSCADLDFSYVRYTEYSFGKIVNPWVERILKPAAEKTVQLIQGS